MLTVFWLENLQEMDHSKDLGVDGKILRMDLREIGWEGVDLMLLPQDGNQ
jgi:hypothetical protein